MADYNSDRTGSNIDAVLDKADNLTQAAVGVGGNVGIGTASPTTNYTKTIHVHSATNGASVHLTDSASGSTANDGLEVFQYGVDGYVWERGNGTLRFGTNATERARIDSSGNLLVGKTALNYNNNGTGLLASGEAQFTATAINPLEINRKVSDGSIINFRKDGTTVGSIGVNSTTPYMSGNLGGFRLTSAAGAGVMIPTDTLGNASDADNDLGISTVRWRDLYLSGGVRALAVETGTSLARHRFGYEPTTQWCAVYKADSANSGNAVVFMNSSAGTVGSIGMTTTSTSFNTSSDYRLKENVSEMDNASERVKALKPCRFNFTVDPDKTVDGFLAHEAQEVVPEAVHGTKDGMRTEEYEVTPAVLDDDGNVVEEVVMGTREVPDYQGIDQSKLVPLLTKALQEALQRIEILENK